MQKRFRGGLDMDLTFKRRTGPENTQGKENIMNERKENQKHPTYGQIIGAIRRAGQFYEKGVVIGYYRYCAFTRGKGADLMAEKKFNFLGSEGDFNFYFKREINTEEIAAAVNDHPAAHDGFMKKSMKEHQDEFHKAFEDHIKQVMADTKEKKHSHYHKDVSDLETIDIYDVLHLFDVKSHSVGHAIKKLLMAGKRGAKGYKQDLQEAIDSVQREIDRKGE